MGACGSTNCADPKSKAMRAASDKHMNKSDDAKAPMSATECKNTDNQITDENSFQGTTSLLKSWHHKAFMIEGNSDYVFVCTGNHKQACLQQIDAYGNNKEVVCLQPDMACDRSSANFCLRKSTKSINSKEVPLEKQRACDRSSTDTSLLKDAKPQHFSLKDVAACDRSTTSTTCTTSPETSIASRATAYSGTIRI